MEKDFYVSKPLVLWDAGNDRLVKRIFNVGDEQSESPSMSVTTAKSPISSIKPVEIATCPLDMAHSLNIVPVSDPVPATYS